MKASKDGIAVSRLRKAGAIPLCVTNTPELCVSIETYNQVTGYTNNPYDMNRSCGGSSGGEVSRFQKTQTLEEEASRKEKLYNADSVFQAALIAASASPLGVGSDFAGSIRVPCLFCGLFGHKPTAGVTQFLFSVIRTVKIERIV